MINTSQTINAAVRGVRESGEPVELHFSNRLSKGEWIVELRKPGPVASEPLFSAQAGEELRLPGEARVRLLSPFQTSTREEGKSHVRLWRAAVKTPLPVYAYLEQHGFPNSL